jgi:hypothetical protein
MLSAINKINNDSPLKRNEVKSYQNEFTEKI